MKKLFCNAYRHKRVLVCGEGVYFDKGGVSEDLSFRPHLISPLLGSNPGVVMVADDPILKVTKPSTPEGDPEPAIAVQPFAIPAPRSTKPVAPQKPVPVAPPKPVVEAPSSKGKPVEPSPKEKPPKAAPVAKPAPIQAPKEPEIVRPVEVAPPPAASVAAKEAASSPSSVPTPPPAAEQFERKGPRNRIPKRKIEK